MSQLFQFHLSIITHFSAPYCSNAKKVSLYNGAKHIIIDFERVFDPANPTLTLGQAAGDGAGEEAVDDPGEEDVDGQNEDDSEQAVAADAEKVGADFIGQV